LISNLIRHEIAFPDIECKEKYNKLYRKNLNSNK
jgi:hypothetical protein